MIGRESGGRSRETNHETRLNDENREADEAGGAGRRGGDGRGARRNRYHTRDKKYPRSRAIATISLLRFTFAVVRGTLSARRRPGAQFDQLACEMMTRRKPARTQRATDNHRRVHSHVLPRSEVGWYVDAGSRGPHPSPIPLP